MINDYRGGNTNAEPVPRAFNTVLRKIVQSDGDPRRAGDLMIAWVNLVRKNALQLPPTEKSFSLLLEAWYVTGASQQVARCSPFLPTGACVAMVRVTTLTRAFSG